MEQLTEQEKTYLPKVLSLWHRLDRWLTRFEGSLVILALALMILMAFSQVIMRQFFKTGIFWFDPFVRHLLLFVGFVGASLATFECRHINIDALSKFFKGLSKRGVYILVSFVSAAICLILCLAAFEFVKQSLASGEKIHSVFPAWIAQSVMPYALFVMSLRFLKQGLMHVVLLVKKVMPEVRGNT